MKSKCIFFPGLLLVLGLGVMHLPTFAAQSTNSTPEQPAEAAPAESVETKVSNAIKEVHSDAAIGAMAKTTAVGTNHIYVVQFSTGGKKMRAEVLSEGTLLETEEPGNIKTFPGAANDAVRKAITGMGVKDLGLRVGHTYAEIQKDAAGEPTVVKLSTPMTTYRANVQNNKGEPGRFSFREDGSPVERPVWAK